MNQIEIKGLDETIYSFTCDNGLKVYMWVNDRVKSTFMSLSVKYGSIDTEFIIKNKKYKVPNGLAHFLEHIKFNEPDGTTAHDFYFKTGAEVNAFTTFEYTSYHVYAVNKIEENLNHLLDFVQTPFFNNQMIENEKGIIIEEEKMGEDDPETINYFGIFKNLFENSKYKNLVTGNIEDIKNTTLNDIELVYNNFYHPENMFLCITGNFNPYEIKEVIKENQNKKEFLEYQNPKVITPKEKNKFARKYHEEFGNVTTPRLKVALKIPRNSLKEYTDLEVRIYLNLILNINFGSTSEFKDFLLKSKLATTIYPIMDIYDSYIAIIISAETRFPKEATALIKEKFRNIELTKQEVKRKVRAQIATLITSYDDVEGVNYKIQDYIINYNNIMDNIKNCYESVTVDKLNKFLSNLNLNETTEYVLIPNKKNTKKN